MCWLLGLPAGRSIGAQVAPPTRSEYGRTRRDGQPKKLRPTCPRDACSVGCRGPGEGGNPARLGDRGTSARYETVLSIRAAERVLRACGWTKRQGRGRRREPGAATQRRAVMDFTDLKGAERSARYRRLFALPGDPRLSPRLVVATSTKAKDHG